MFMSPQYKDTLVTLAADEAHCVHTWGNEFRMTFALIGELRSVLPRSTSIVALTATATSDTENGFRELSMVNPIIVALLSYRENIFYRVNCRTDMETFPTSLFSELKRKRKLFSKTVIYVRTYSD